MASVAMDVPEGDGDRRYQPSIEDTSRPRKREEIGRRGAELVEVRDEEQQFGADQGGDDDVNAEVEDAVGIESPPARPNPRELQASRYEAASRTPYV
jgi:hypothetical protein